MSIGFMCGCGIRRVVVPALALAVALLVCCGMLAGCTAPAKRLEPEIPAAYVLVYLKDGPSAGQGTKEERQEIFRGHMSNMNALAERGDLVIAGPFDKPRDPAWRGIFVLNVGDVARAREIAATDPGIKAGEFSVELVPMSGSHVLRKTVELDRKLKENLPPAEAGKPPPNIRKYVMVHAHDVKRAQRAMRDSGWQTRVVWAGRLEGASGSEAVYVLDATDPAEIEKRLNEAGAGEIGVDGWWSTTGLMELPRDAGTL